MEFIGTLSNLYTDCISGAVKAEIEIPKENLPALTALLGKKYSFSITEPIKKRSIGANALFWKYVGILSRAVGKPKDEVYKQILKDYGVFDAIRVSSSCYERFSSNFRLCEIVGSQTTDGILYLDVLCYKPTHEYSVNEFYCLMEGLKQELTNLDMKFPSKKEIEDAAKKLVKGEEK